MNATAPKKKPRTGLINSVDLPSRQSILTFIKAQFSAFVGALFDYGIMIVLTEYGGIHYTRSIIISGIFGAIINFSLNRYWAFNSREVSQRTQLFRFVCVVLSSITIKSAGTYVLTELIQLDYKICRFMVDAVVSFGINYPMQKYWVFKKEA